MWSGSGGRPSLNQQLNSVPRSNNRILCGLVGHHAAVLAVDLEQNVANLGRTVKRTTSTPPTLSPDISLGDPSATLMMASAFCTSTPPWRRSPQDPGAGRVRVTWVLKIQMDLQKLMLAHLHPSGHGGADCKQGKQRQLRSRCWIQRTALSKLLSIEFSVTLCVRGRQ